MLFAIVFLSGVAALLLETLWFRLAGLALGNSVEAAGVVLASFMGGLAVGSGLAARFGDRAQRPLLLYALLETAIAVLGASLVFVFPWLSVRLAHLSSGLAGTPWQLHGLRLLAAAALLLAPSAAMGATLPALVRAASSRAGDLGHVLGWLYGWNTLGAMAGALLGEVFLIRSLGLRGTGLAAAALSLLAASAAALLARRAATPFVNPVPSGAGAARLLGAAFLCGAILLALEVVWFRLLLLYINGTSLAFAVLLAVVLAGISAGGFAGSLWLRRDAAAHRFAPFVAVSAAVVGVLSYADFDPVRLHGSEWANDVASIGALALRLMLPGALLSGALFTLLGAALEARLAQRARTTGWLALANTWGAMTGSLLGSFVLLPGLGVERSFFALSVAYALVALLTLPAGGKAPRGMFPALAVLASVIALFPFGLMSGRHLRAIRDRFGGRAVTLEAVREGVSETVVYLRRDLWGEPHFHQLVTNGIAMSGSGLSAKRYMKQYVYWPIAVNPRIRRALLICYGVGSTAKALVESRQLSEIDVVDVSADVLDLAPLVYPPGESPLSDPRVRRHVEDGRFFLGLGGPPYDLITGEPPPPKSAGVVNLYSREYFRLVSDRLSPGGLVTYWLPVNQLSVPETRAIVQAFCGVFPECSLWSGVSYAFMLVGSKGELAPPSEEEFFAQWRDPRVKLELERVGFDTPELMGATFLADAEQLRALAGAEPPLVDDWPLRLGPESPAGDPLYDSLLDARGARERFSRSEYIRRLWPKRLRERTLLAFDVQQLLNARFVAPRPGLLYEELTALLRRPERHPALALWLLYSDADEQRLAARARARGASDALLEYTLGVGALARNDPRAAEPQFRRALELEPRWQALRDHRALALCLAGQREAALAEATLPALRDWIAAGSCAAG